MTDTRLQQASAWLTNSLRLPVSSIKPLAGDASFRRYFRVHLPDICYVLMDAPPEKEDCHPFVAIDEQFINSGIHAPAIIAKDFEQGFLLLEDFGDQLFLSVVNQDNVDELYRLALRTLTRLQQIKAILHYKLPPFDTALMMREMMLFYDWFLVNKLEYQLQPQEITLIQETFAFIAAKITTFQYTCVHRDYHSRNLMILDSGDLGILDFQDAVWGPVTYDAISLLKDCYISWPRDKVIDLLGYYHQLLVSAGVIGDKTFSDFTLEFDWVGVQRHLKVIGIFSRLAIRDHKVGFLKDIPLAMRYLTEALNQFAELDEFNVWLRKSILPIYQERILAAHVL